MKEKLIKCFTPEDWKKYNHDRYEREKQTRLEYQREYYQKNKNRIKKKAGERYRIKCGLGIRNGDN